MFIELCKLERKIHHFDGSFFTYLNVPQDAYSASQLATLSNISICTIDFRTNVLYNTYKKGTSVRKTLDKSVRYGEELEMMYMAEDGAISRRWIKVLQVGEASFRAYCYLRATKRTFRIANVLALIPVTIKERRVI